MEEFPSSDKRPVSFGITQNVTVDYPTSTLFNLRGEVWLMGVCFVSKKGKLDSDHFSDNDKKKAAVAYQ